MGDSDEDNRYPLNPNSSNRHRPYSSSNRHSIPPRNNPPPPVVSNEDYFDTDSDEEGERETEYGNDVDVGDELDRSRKKRKLKSLHSGFEFVSRKPQQTVIGGRDGSLGDWTEYETVALLDTWGDGFGLLGRKSHSSREWVEVAKKVSQATKLVITDTQCRERLETLKKKYKKERMKFGWKAVAAGIGSKWVYFKKMDKLMTAWSASASRQPGLSSGMDCGEYVFMNPDVYLNCSTGLDEMRDSPGNSESLERGEEEDSDGIPPVGKENVKDGQDGSSFKLLADSINKFGEIYEKIENDKRQYMLELEKMRKDFLTDLEIKKKEIMERAQADIARIRQGDDDDDDDVEEEATDDSAAENGTG
ncbi:hypothetical protein GIB67_020570 [Kingdonia uniflora]|uniref:Myb/SANT-like DNA-binding domain-containing protein n=1 Tax=Kingdonia uniflora TaxID=39325 RepID=A0A7J7NLV7_9MAGN|nr:hypothetical protein GIB67_020570 [Kingdonia uniflora]